MADVLKASMVVPEDQRTAWQTTDKCSWQPSEGESLLQVLNVGHAKLIGKVKVGALTSLGALILNDNALTSISGKTCPLNKRTCINGFPSLAPLLISGITESPSLLCITLFIMICKSDVQA